MDVPAAVELTTARLVLEPLRAAHAPAMTVVLAAPALYAFMGGAPPAPAQLTARYTRLERGDAAWRNWIACRDGVPAGHLQATLQGDEAELAWVIGTAHQRRGLATEGALAVQAWLREHGVERFAANIQPEHLASAGVARRLGLAPTGELRGGEIRWASGDPSKRRLDC